MSCSFLVILLIIFINTSDANAKNVFFRYTENYLHAFGNSKALHGLVIQYDKYLAALLDGNNGTGILINIKLKRIYSLKKAWSYSEKYFYQYVRSLDSLEKIYEEVKEDGRSLFPKVSDKTYLKALHILQSLVSKPRNMHQFVDSMTSLIEMNTGITQHLYPGYHYYYIDIFFNDIVDYEKALADLLQGIDGGLPRLAKDNGTKINMYEIFKGSSPAIIVLTYIRQLGNTCNLTQFPVFKSSAKLMKVFKDLNGQRDMIQLMTIICQDREKANQYLERLQKKGEEIKKLLMAIHESQQKYGDIESYVQKQCRVFRKP